MSGSLIGALRVTLGIDTAAFEQGLGIAEKRLNAAGKKMQAVGDRMAGIGANLTMGLTAPLVAFGISASKAANESAAALAQVNASLSSMGPVAGKTTEQLQEAAAQLQHMSTFDDDDILAKVTANMLTFGNITGDVFDRAQQAVVDYAAKTGNDLQGTTIMIAKALNDPLKGLTSLGKVGVQFTAQQKEQIAAMMGVGNIAGAQAVILGELEQQYARSAKAQRDATPGADTVDAWRNFNEIVGKIINDVLPKLTGVLTTALNAFNNLNPGTQTFVVGLAAAAAAIGPVLMAVGGMTSIIGGLVPVFAPVVALIGEAGLGAALAAAATAAAPFIAVAAALAAGWALFGDKIGPVLSALGTKFQEVLGPKFMSMLDTVKKTISELWAGPFGTAVKVVIDILGELNSIVATVLGESIIRILSVLVSVVESGFKFIGDVFRILGALMTGDFSAAWRGVGTLVSNIIDGWLAILESLAPGAVTALTALVRGVQEWIGNKLTAIWEAANKKITEVADKFKWLWDVVVGHSYVPDMVDAIGQNMARLQGLMVDPAKRAADGAGEAFRALASDVSGVLDRLFPLQAQLRGVLDDMAKLDRARAGGIIDQATYDAANAKLAAERGDLQGQINPGSPMAAMLFEPLQAAMVDLSGVIGTIPKIASEATLALQEYGQQLGDGIMGGLRDVLSGRSNMQDMLRDMFSDFLFRLTSDTLKNLETSLFGESGLGGFLGDLLVGAFSGKAVGGPVMANTPYIVGEKRPELFVPSTAGRIVPNLNGAGRGAGGNSPLEIRVTKSNLFDIEVTRIADGRVSSGIAGYDRNVGSRVKDNLARRG